METQIEIKVDRDVARALYERLLKPGKDNEGNTVYTVSLTLAQELRNALFSAVEGK